jgi:hypothetical protein
MGPFKKTKKLEPLADRLARITIRNRLPNAPILGDWIRDKKARVEQYRNQKQEKQS